MVNIYLCAYCSLCAIASASLCRHASKRAALSFGIFIVIVSNSRTHSRVSTLPKAIHRTGWLAPVPKPKHLNAHHSFYYFFLRGGDEDGSVACWHSRCASVYDYDIVGTCNHKENQTKCEKLAFSGSETRQWQPDEIRKLCTAIGNMMRAIYVCFVYKFSFVRWLHAPHSESGASRLNRREMWINAPQAQTHCLRPV